jgi:hypothetical protein
MNIKDIPYARLLQLATSSETGYLFELSDRETYANHLGTVAAAAQFSLAELASGQWLLEAFPEYASIAIPMLRKAEAKFRKPAKGVVRARVCVSDTLADQTRQQLELKKRVLITIPVEVLDGDHEIVMKATYEWFIQVP